MPTSSAAWTAAEAAFSQLTGQGKEPSLAGYEIDARTLRERSERLRALRLARDAASQAVRGKLKVVRTAR